MSAIPLLRPDLELKKVTYTFKGTDSFPYKELNFTFPVTLDSTIERLARKTIPNLEIIGKNQAQTNPPTKRSSITFIGNKEQIMVMRDGTKYAINGKDSDTQKKILQTVTETLPDGEELERKIQNLNNELAKAQATIQELQNKILQQELQMENSWANCIKWAAIGSMATLSGILAYKYINNPQAITNILQSLIHLPSSLQQKPAQSLSSVSPAIKISSKSHFFTSRQMKIYIAYILMICKKPAFKI